VVIDPGTASEEKILCSTRSGTTVNFTTRGADGSAAAAHSSGATIYPIGTAVDLDEANYAVSQTVGLIAAQGDIIRGSAANTFAKLAKGTSGYPLVAGSSDLSYAQLTETGIAASVAGDGLTGANGSPLAINPDNSTIATSGDQVIVKSGGITGTQLASGAVTAGKIGVGGVSASNQFAAGVVDASALATGAVTSGKILDGTIATADFAAGAVDATALGALAVTTAKIAANAVTVAKLDAAVPQGIVGGAPAIVTADQGSISGTYVDLTSLTVTLTPSSATRYIRLRGFMHFSSGVANDEIQVAVREGSTVLCQVSATHVTGSTLTEVPIEWVVVDATAAAHTYKLSAKLGTGTGPFTMKANDPQKAWFYAEDIGGH
jgi:hypothetical protein